jgi:hypothetical protein
VVDRGEHCLRADGITEFSEVLVVKLLAVIDCQFGWDSEPTYGILPKKLCVVLDVIVEAALPSIHLVKYSIVTKANLRFP